MTAACISLIWGISTGAQLWPATNEYMQILQRRNEYMQILQRRRGGEWLAVYKYERMRAILASLYLFVDTPAVWASVVRMHKLDLNSVNRDVGNPLVIMSASWCRVGICRTLNWPSATFFLTKWMSSSTCFVHRWWTGFWDKYTADMLSQ